MRKVFIFLSIIGIAYLFGCIKKKKHKINEGQITYSIEYDSLTLEKIDKKILPTTLTVRFKDNNTFNSIEALSGAVNISIISQPSEERYVTLLKVFNKKLYHDEPYTSEHYPALYSKIPPVVIDSLQENIEYLGFKCKKVRGHFADSPDFKFDIIFTNEIQIEDPNINTPFESVKGVMLVFNLRFNKLNMFLKAQSVEEVSINTNEFQIPSDYKHVDFTTMSELVYLLQQ